MTVGEPSTKPTQDPQTPYTKGMNNDGPMPKMMDITISEETYAIIQKLAADRMDDLLSIYDECDQVPYHAQRILEAVTMFSSWDRGAIEQLAQFQRLMP